MTGADILQMDAEEALQEYDIHPGRGFLPGEDPLVRFEDGPTYADLDEDAQDYLSELDDAAHNIHDLLQDDALRWQARQLPVPGDDLYEQLTEQELFHLYQAASFVGSAYVHKTGDDAQDVDHIPAGVAAPLYESTRPDRLDVPPILSYDAYSLHNWRRLDPDGPIELGNIDTIYNFVELEDGPENDESWFMLVHVEIEEEAGDAIASVPDALQAVDADDPDALYDALTDIEASLQAMADTMARMPEHNDPDNYDNHEDNEHDGFRPYIEPFEGVTFESVPELHWPQHLRGETGAQSTIYPTLDRTFGVQHDTNELKEHIEEMVSYMPSGHRDWLHDLEDTPDVSSYVQQQDDAELHAVHDSIVQHMISFRFIHWQYAKTYIEDKTGDTEGTGGTEYVQFLPDLIDKTEELLVQEPHDHHWQYLAHTFDADQMPDGIGPSL